MKKLLIYLLFVPLFAGAQDKLCDTTNALALTLQTDYGEVPMLTGRTEDGVLSVWYNPKTKTFTILETSPDAKTSCVISVGKNLKPYVGVTL